MQAKQRGPGNVREQSNEERTKSEPETTTTKKYVIAKGKHSNRKRASLTAILITSFEHNQP